MRSKRTQDQRQRGADSRLKGKSVEVFLLKFADSESDSESAESEFFFLAAGERGGGRRGKRGRGGFGERRRGTKAATTPFATALQSSSGHGGA